MFQLSDIEVGDRVLFIGGYIAKWFTIDKMDLVYAEKNPSKLELIKDIVKHNKQSQQDIISHTVDNFNLTLANEVNNRIDNLIKQLTAEASE